MFFIVTVFKRCVLSNNAMVFIMKKANYSGSIRSMTILNLVHIVN
jgi:hypothetical protein